LPCLERMMYVLVLIWVMREEQGRNMSFHIPVKGNLKLQKVLENIGNDAELIQLFKCANMNAVDRSGINDHGEVHIRIASNAGLRILRLLVRGGVVPSVVKDYGMEVHDAEVVVVLAACLHDIGIAIHRHDHERHSLVLAYPKSRQLLEGVYEEPALTIMTSEVMHAIVAHNAKETCLTVEAGVLKVADALDMSQGRSRIPFEAGKVNIHSISARAVENVDIEPGEERPVRIVITLANSAGIYQVDELLRHKLQNSSIAEHVEVIARIEGEMERRIVETYRL
jgi:metal-dependent HD superfamily phosphatase/phosphodiesterase